MQYCTYCTKRAVPLIHAQGRIFYLFIYTVYSESAYSMLPMPRHMSSLMRRWLVPLASSAAPTPGGLPGLAAQRVIAALQSGWLLRRGAGLLTDTCQYGVHAGRCYHRCRIVHCQRPLTLRVSPMWSVERVSGVPPLIPLSVLNKLVP